MANDDAVALQKASVRAISLGMSPSELPASLEAALEMIIVLKRDVVHLRGVTNSQWNERAALFRRNLPAPEPGTDRYKDIQAELSLITAAFKVAKLLPFKQHNDPNDPCIAFHLALRKVIETRLQIALDFTKQDALDQGNDPAKSYEALYTHPTFAAPPVRQ